MQVQQDMQNNDHRVHLQAKVDVAQVAQVASVASLLAQTHLQVLQLAHEIQTVDMVQEHQNVAEKIDAIIIVDERA
jgi:hypothetical protein